jgi:phosphatidylinositol alpha-1,6-mannosyltransferase
MARLFFVSRAFPPVLGGIENHNHQLSEWLARSTDLVLLANRQGKKALPFFALKAFFLLLFRLRRGDVVVLGDGVLAPLGWLIRRLRRVSVVGIVHGLDVTYASRLYQALWVGHFLPGLSGLIAVSQATRDEAMARGIPGSLVQVVPNGVDVDALTRPGAGGPAECGLPAANADKVLLLTIGRMVRRKGVAWFVERVMPGLPAGMVYVVAGDGPESGRVAALVAEKGLDDRVLLLGRIGEEQKVALLRQAALFIQPNIVVEADMEGFGISVIEASACGTPVVAADLQGLRDSVLDGETGVRLPAEDAGAWISYLNAWTPAALPRERVATATAQAFSWPSVAQRYLEAIRTVVRREGRQAESLSL